MPDSRPYILGVDGGNTKTIALVARRDGAIIGAGRAGCSDMYGARSSEAASEQLALAVEAALAQAGAEAAQIESGVFSMAGGDWPEDLELLGQIVRARGYGQVTRVYNDAIGALRAGSPDGIGVVVACGTGAAIGARAADGRTWHLGFWFEHGGSDHLGQQALRAAMRAELGIAPPTSLTARLLAATGAPSVAELLRRRTGRDIPPDLRPSTDRMGRALLDCAAEGDPTAAQIVAAHGVGLGDYALAAARMVGLGAEPFTLALTGGVLRHPSTLLVDTLVAHVQERAPGAQPRRSSLEPAAGALLLAIEQAAIVADDGVLAKLTATLPPAGFFET